MKFDGLTQWARRAVPCLDASNTIEETKRTNQLTMVAFFSAPPSLNASFLSIHGRSSIRGTKYCSGIVVAVSAAVLIVAFSRLFGAMRQAIRNLRSDCRGKARDMRRRKEAST